jgi:hypothetical protein
LMNLMVPGGMTSCVFCFLPVIIILTIFKNNSRINWHYWAILLALAHIVRTPKRYCTELELKPRSSRGQEAKQAKLNRRNTCSARIRASQSLLVCQVHGRKLASMQVMLKSCCVRGARSIVSEKRVY